MINSYAKTEVSIVKNPKDQRVLQVRLYYSNNNGAQPITVNWFVGIEKETHKVSLRLCSENKNDYKNLGFTSTTQYVLDSQKMDAKELAQKWVETQIDNLIKEVVVLEQIQGEFTLLTELNTFKSIRETEKLKEKLKDLIRTKKHWIVSGIELYNLYQNMFELLKIDVEQKIEVNWGGIKKTEETTKHTFYFVFCPELNQMVVDGSKSTIPEFVAFLLSKQKPCQQEPSWSVC